MEREFGVPSYFFAECSGRSGGGGGGAMSIRNAILCNLNWPDAFEWTPSMRRQRIMSGSLKSQQVAKVS